MSEPHIISDGSTGFYIVFCGQWWAAKNGMWVGGGIGNWRTRSRFRSRKAAELELERIRLHLTPEVQKAAKLE